MASKRHKAKAVAHGRSAEAASPGWWTAEPRDTLVTGDGRPVGNTGGSRSLDLPWPSTLAGFVRSQVGSRDGVFRMGARETARLKEVEVAGPWLVAIGADGSVVDRYFLAPQDLLWHPGSAGGLQRTRLVPTPREADCVIDPRHRDLELLRPSAPLPDGKPARGPAFWREADLVQWLHTPPAQDVVDQAFGLTEVLHEQRWHVALDPDSGTARDAHLFSTDGVRYPLQPGGRLAIGFRCGDDRLTVGLGVLGGEGRISHLRTASPMRAGPVPALGASPRRVRLVLITPAIFAAGSVPEHIAGARVVAAAVGRPQIVSGWDYAARGPKPARRMAPAGSVYWVEIEEGVDPADWARQRWMQSVSDTEQDRRDGFGLALVGIA